MSGSAKPTLSVVIEWENARNSEHARAMAMLRALIAQIKALEARLGGRPEIILVHDAEEAAAGSVLEGVRADAGDYIAAFKTVAADGLDYYQQKTLGARQASGDLILFVDSDVIPDEGWLQQLFDCHIEEGADVVCGTTSMDASSLYTKAFALFWFFPLEKETIGRQRTGHFFANNVLFRAEVFRENPFPESELVRGQCIQLAQALLARPHSIFIEPRAHVRHPPPNGLKHFVYRALCHGHDNVFLGEPRGMLLALRRCRWRLFQAFKRIVVRRRHVELSMAGVMVAFAIATAYNVLELTGELATLANRRDQHFIQKRFRV